MRLKDLKIGYAPLNKNFDHPGDLRRFCYFAEKRNIKFEPADPSEAYDLVILTQNADISIWSEYQKGNCKIIYDFVDSYLHVPLWNLKGVLRGAAKYFAGQNRYLRLNHWKALQAMCQRADGVACSTEEQKISILPFCKNVHVILDFHFTLMCSTKVDYSAGQPFNMVWEGMPGNLKFVFEISEVLKELSKKYDIAFHAVTDLSYGKYMGKYCIRSTQPLAKKIFKNSYVHEWKAESLASTVSSFDLAIIPIPLNKPFGQDNSLAIGKPENKLLLLWRMGMPTVVSATPAYKRVMDQCGLPMACQTKDEWFNTLEKYINDEALRRKVAQNGKSFVENNYSEDILLSKWDNLLSSVLVSKNKG